MMRACELKARDKGRRRSILRQLICYVILFIMSTATAKLLSEFGALPVEENQEFVLEVINHLPPRDSGALSENVAAAAGDALAER
jgi:hypothetical protein